MRDIKLTLSTNPSKRSPSIEEEAHWLEQEGQLWYPLGAHRPLKAEPGCWVYFIRKGRVVARARAAAFDPPSRQAEYTYTGSSAHRTAWEVRITRPMELARAPLDHRGFQGFRYVTLEEREAFEQAFDSEPLVGGMRPLTP